MNDHKLGRPPKDAAEFPPYQRVMVPRGEDPRGSRRGAGTRVYGICPKYLIEALGAVDALDAIRAEIDALIGEDCTEW